MGRARGLFYGWWIVLAGSALGFYTGGSFFYGFSAFFKPIMKDLALSYAATSLAYSLQRLEGGIMAPLVGFLVDRVGPRKLVFAGSAVVGIGFILLSQVNSLLTYYGAFVILSAGMGAASYGIGNVVVANWFRRRVGRALGLVAIGFGLSGIMVPLLVWLIATLGWRETPIFLGVGMWVVGLPLALVPAASPRTTAFSPMARLPLPMRPRPTLPQRSSSAWARR
ncbi:MAG: MFS transporter [Chloroflexota bacterium]|nr:MFS transporter [Chloroflexota bacterium]